MENIATSPAPNQPRSPNPDELAQLADWLQSQGHDREVAVATAADASVAVYDDYATGCPGYAGKLMSVVWDGAPSFFDVFIWQDGKMVRSGRDYDEKECDCCGGKNATLCANCWRRHERQPSASPTIAAKHTPGPWNYDNACHPEFDLYMYSEADSNREDPAICMIAPGPEVEANAEFIVRACNAHDDLVEACNHALDTLRSLAEHQAFWGDAPEFNRGGYAHESCDLLESVLARARGNAQ